VDRVVEHFESVQIHCRDVRDLVDRALAESSVHRRSSHLRFSGSKGGASPQPQRGTGACFATSAPGWELCIARRVPHSA
jgi:hypothetical protein